MAEALIIDALRTPMGRFRGALSGVRPDDLAAHVVAAAVERSGIEPGAVEDVYMGAANQAGRGQPRRRADGGAARRASRSARPGVTVNRLCASGLEAVNQASRALRLGEGDLYLAGGVESMSRAPWVVPKPESGLPRGEQTMHDTALGWRLINPRMAERYSTEAMGETAENVAERYGISREEQDEFALRSHQRAVAAAEAGRFDDEIVAVEASRERRRPGPCRGRRGPASRQQPRAAREAAARVPRGRDGDGRQRLDAQRRRRLSRAGVRAASGRARRRAAGPRRLGRRRRRRPRLHGDRARRGGAAGARAPRA